MSKTIIGLILLGYVLMGIFVSSAITGESTEGSLLLILFWPIALFMLLVFGVVALVHKAGLKIHELFF